MSALWGFTGPPSPELVTAMAGALRHRTGPAAPVVAAGPRCTIAVAGSNPSDHAVVTTPDGTMTVAFTGRLGCDATISSFAERVATEGPDAMARLRGEWIIAIASRDRLVIGRDAAGVRTVYWGSHNGRVLLAIEPKGVTRVEGFPRRIHPPALAQFLAFSFVPGERCALADLSEVPAGHRLEVDLIDGSTHLVRWFVHEDIEVEDAPQDVWIKRARATIDDAVRERVAPSAPYAAFLSGGLDSSLVTTVAAQVCRERGDDPPTAWSLHFGAKYPNEVAFASAVATRIGVDHRVIEVSPPVVAEHVRTMMWHLDEPIGDPVTAGNWFLARAAASEAHSILNGEGGDPVFGGPKNLPMLLAHWYPDAGNPRFREAQYLATWRRAGEEITALLHPDLLAEIDLDRDLNGVVRPYLHAARPPDLLNKLMITNMRLKGAHLILPKVDRMLGAFGAHPLSPLFDEDVIRLSLAMPPTMKLHHGIEKWVLKEAYRDVLPPEVVDRPKSGMRVPVRWWFQRELQPLVRELLSTRAVRRAGIFNAERVRDLRRCRSGRDGLRLWMLVNLELWRRIVVEGESP
jgi:asparagine synthase (glutamine-hydrolysing)